MPFALQSLHMTPNQPAQPAEPPIKQSSFVTVSDMKTQNGAQVRRFKTQERPDPLAPVFVEVLKLQRDALKSGSKITDLSELTVLHEKEPAAKLRFGQAVNTYATLTEGSWVSEPTKEVPRPAKQTGLIIRFYVHIPAGFKRAVLFLLDGAAKELNLNIHESPDTFIRPSGI